VKVTLVDAILPAVSLAHNINVLCELLIAVKVVFSVVKVTLLPLY